MELDHKDLRLDFEILSPDEERRRNLPSVLPSLQKPGEASPFSGQADADLPELFDEEGCLSDFALNSAASGYPELPELNRLEISEHLSFCDRCVDRFTALLTGEALELPVPDLAETIMQRVRRKAKTIFFNRYVTAAVAASIAMTLWVTGVFTDYGVHSTRRIARDLANGTQSFAEAAGSVTQSVSDALRSLIFDNGKGIDFYGKE